MREPEYLMNQRIRIATRGSTLARAQTKLVADALMRINPNVQTELVRIITTGDRRRGPLADAGGKGLFTLELEAALRERHVDLAVHSAKDLPARMSDGLVIAAVPPREDPRDALVTRLGPLLALPSA